jgi:hypothetical protein
MEKIKQIHWETPILIIEEIENTENLVDFLMAS